ncbi:MAG TPA: hypothetical protein VFR93_02450 [Candidatus Limnocylindrales bacterium]|nr:hypothetical protein [Candidatus Limnocylindrales bacterium]
MPRAKRTDRAEARRRYRAEQAALASAETEDGLVDEDGSAAAPGRTAATKRAATPRGGSASTTSTGRQGILDGIRASLRPANIREDVRTAPAVLRATPLLWIPFAVVVVSAVLALIPGLIDYQIPSFLVQTFLFPPPLIAPFIAGLLAPRAGWLFGLLTGLLSGILFALFVVTTPGSAAAATTITPEVRLQYVGYALVTSPTFGLLVGAFASFYRRFLRSTASQRANQNRSRRSASRSTASRSRR